MSDCFLLYRALFLCTGFPDTWCANPIQSIIHQLSSFMGKDVNLLIPFPYLPINSTGGMLAFFGKAWKKLSMSSSCLGFSALYTIKQPYAPFWIAGHVDSYLFSQKSLCDSSWGSPIILCISGYYERQGCQGKETIKGECYHPTAIQLPLQSQVACD